MAKRPFGVRIEQSSVDRFRALSAVLGIDGSDLFNALLLSKEKELTDEQEKAYKQLLKVWRD